MLGEFATISVDDGLPAYVPRPAAVYQPPPPPRAVIGLRPATAADRPRVEEICSEVFRGRDRLPQRFDGWVEDDDASFLVAEVDGRLAAMHRLVPAGDGIVWYEGLRVAPEYRGRGLGRTMVGMGLSSGQRRGFAEMRLHAGPECGPFFESIGFSPVVQVARWDAEPAPRGHLPTVLAAEHTDVALGWLQQDDAFNRYPGMKPVFGRSAAGDRRNVNALAREGTLRFSGDVPAFAAVRPALVDEPLRVTFLAGTGESMYDLLKGIRHQAHIEGVERVRVVAPTDHACAAELEAAGFAVRDDFRLTVYSRPLGSRPQN
ncbi:MAG TPA: GNAT family N-acetyltransferase [Candidatus Dormibacteraeota bacterium]